MNRKIILAIALVLSIVLVSLTSSDSRVAAQNQIKIIADTGVITLGPGQTLRVSVASPRDSASGSSTAFRRIEYAQGVCNGAICKLAISSQTTSAPITLAPGEAVSFDHIGNFNFRGVVLSNRRDVQVNVIIIDNATGEVVAYENMFVIEL